MERSFHGTVEAFDEHRGLGVIRSEDGRAVDFHCIGIADGSRSIPVGQPVRFRELAKLGRYEATDIAPR